MSNPIPTQVRAIDPYASYNSNIANRLTRVVTNGEDCLIYPNPIDVESLSTTTVTVTGGKCVKDDVLIETQDLVVDFTDSTSYIFISGSPFQEAGYYYIVMSYIYAKVQPPNEASVALIHPSQRGTLYNPSEQIFLKCAEISEPSPGTFQIDALHDFDPSNPSIGRNVKGADPSLGTAGAPVQFVETSSNHFADINDNTIAVSGNSSIYLPLTSSLVGKKLKELRIVKVDAAPYITSVTIQGSDTIEGNTTITLTEQWNEVTLIPKPDASVWVEV